MNRLFFALLKKPDFTLHINRNELTSETSWEKPKAEPKSSKQANKKKLPCGWKEIYHESTGQVMYENEVTKERRWEAPSGFDDVSDIKPQEGSFKE